MYIDINSAQNKVRLITKWGCVIKVREGRIKAAGFTLTKELASGCCGVKLCLMRWDEDKWVEVTYRINCSFRDTQVWCSLEIAVEPGCYRCIGTHFAREGSISEREPSLTEKVYIE